MGKADNIRYWKQVRQQESPDIAVKYSKEDLLTARAAISEVKISDSEHGLMYDIRQQAGEQGLWIPGEEDDRKLAWLINRVVCGEALLAGHQKVEAEDFEVLQHCLWNEAEDHTKAAQLVMALSNPVAEECNKKVDDSTLAFTVAQEQEDQGKANDASFYSDLLWWDADAKCKAIEVDLQARVDETSGKSQERLAEACQKVKDIRHTIQADKLNLQA